MDQGHATFMSDTGNRGQSRRHEITRKFTPSASNPMWVDINPIRFGCSRLMICLKTIWEKRRFRGKQKVLLYTQFGPPFFA
jgi:hypothetical protein